MTPMGDNNPKAWGGDVGGGGRGYSPRPTLLKPSLLSVSTFQGMFFSFLRSSSILLSQFLSSWRSCCASACSLSRSPRAPPDPPPGSATSNSFSFLWHSASFRLHSLQPLSSSSFSFWNCSILSTRAWKWGGGGCLMVLGLWGVRSKEQTSRPPHLPIPVHPVGTALSRDDFLRKNGGGGAFRPLPPRWEEGSSKSVM